MKMDESDYLRQVCKAQEKFIGGAINKKELEQELEELRLKRIERLEKEVECLEALAENERILNHCLENITNFGNWLREEPSKFPLFWRWKKWRDSRPMWNDLPQGEE